MKKNNIVLFGIAVLCACSVPKERQPLTGGRFFRSALLAGSSCQ